MKSKYANLLYFFRKTIRMWTFEAKKLALELKVLRSQTRCQLRLEVNFNKQQLKHAESTSRSRGKCKKLVRFKLLICS